MQEIQVLSLLLEDNLEKEMATHSSIIVWKISWAEMPGGLQSIGLQKSQTRLSDLVYLIFQTIPVQCTQHLLLDMFS